MFDLRTHNRNAWDRRVENGNRWTRPVTSAETAAARRGEWQIGVTGFKPVPRFYPIYSFWRCLLAHVVGIVVALRPLHDGAGGTLWVPFHEQATKITRFVRRGMYAQL